MNDAEIDKLLEQGLSGDPPRAEFREQVLQDSVATLVRRRRTRALWRTGTLSAAAVLIAGVSFLLGRCSLPLVTVAPVPSTLVAGNKEAVAVPSELVEWLDAARLFQQLGMEDRMARALDHAHKLLPYDTVAADTARGVGPERPGTPVAPRPSSPGSRPLWVENVNHIMAQSLGD